MLRASPWFDDYFCFCLIEAARAGFCCVLCAEVEMTADAREDEDTVLPATSVSLNHTGSRSDPSRATRHKINKVPPNFILFNTILNYA